MSVEDVQFRKDRRRVLEGAAALVLVSGLPKNGWATLGLPPFNPGSAPGVDWPMHEILSPSIENSLAARLLAKPVLARNPLNEISVNWSATPSAGVVMAKGLDGKPVIRLTSPMLNVEFLEKDRAPNGSSNGGAGYLVEGDGANFWRLTLNSPQDWRAFNRIGFQVFVHDTGLDSYAFGMGFVDSAAPAQGPTGPLSFTYIQNLVAGQWNAVVWEFPEVPRSQVVEFAISQPLRGPTGNVAYDVRDLAIQRVAPEKVEGWEVAPGRVAYNHVGYRSESSKFAFVNGMASSSFELLDAKTGQSVAQFPVEKEDTRLGSFQRLDFSSFTKPGRYRIRIGDQEGQSFSIGENLWLGVVEKLLNFFYADRCGHAAPGLHGVCHRDVRGEHDGIFRPLNGGWHDAGNGSQGSYRTGVCTEGLLAVYAQLASRPDQRKLAKRTLEEACWGLDWLLRTRFGAGFRVIDVGYSIYTNGRLGDYDDIVRPATLDVFENFIFVSVAADAARLLKSEDPLRASSALEAALDDYTATMRVLPTASPRRAERNSAAPFQEYAYGVIAAIALQRATGNISFLDDAVKFGDRLLACQHTELIGDTRITGFFYEDENHKQPSHEFHTSFADAAPRALAALCTALPDHPQWMLWRAAIVLYSEGFLLEGSRASDPYQHLPNVVWRDDQFAAFVEASIGGMRYFPPKIGYKYIQPINEQAMRAGYAEEFAAAMRLAEGFRLRTFPIPPDPVFHGATTVQLAMTAGLLAAAGSLSNLSLQALAERQLDWVFGGNPFSNCLMYGEGYDFVSQFQAIARDMVGSVPVGMDNRQDRPFWPTANHFTFKEMWVVPAGQLLKVLAPLVGGARVRGNATVGAQFQATRSKHTQCVSNGKFDVRLPPGDYQVQFGGSETRRTYVSGADYDQQLEPSEAVAFDVSVKTDGAATLELNATVVGAGSHTFRLLTWNARADGESDVTMTAPGRHTWTLNIADKAKPWVATVFLDKSNGQTTNCWGRA